MSFPTNIMKIGYAKVSSIDKNLSLQEDALSKAGCEKIFKDLISGPNSKNPGLSQAIDYASKGDSFVVWRLDVLGSSLKDLMAIVGAIERKGLEIISIHESINTKTSSGKLNFQMLGSLAEFERNIISKRTAGLNAIDHNEEFKSIKKICEVCDHDFSDELENNNAAGGLVFFADFKNLVENVLEHLDGLGWFCAKHINDAKFLSGLTKPMVLLQLRHNFRFNTAYVRKKSI